MEETLLRDTEIEARFVLQMHDELMYEVRGDCAPSFYKLIKLKMEKVSQYLQVKLPVKVKSGPDWSNLVVVDEF